MIAPPLLRFRSRSSFMGRALTVRSSVPMAICSLPAIPVILAHPVPCRMSMWARLSSRIRTICSPIRHRRIARILPVAVAFSPRPRVPRPTGSLTLNGARLMLAEAARPTLKFASTRAQASSTSSMGRLPTMAAGKKAACSKAQAAARPRPTRVWRQSLRVGRKSLIAVLRARRTIMRLPPPPAPSCPASPTPAIIATIALRPSLCPSRSPSTTRRSFRLVSHQTAICNLRVLTIRISVPFACLAPT